MSHKHSDYRSQPWFALMQNACERFSQTQVALLLGVSQGQMSQVVNATGKYGAGTASTTKLASKVLHTFGTYVCPHLTEQKGEIVVIAADKCKAYAHRAAPAGSPRDMQHWQACQRCAHKDHTGPAAPRKPHHYKEAS